MKRFIWLYLLLFNISLGIAQEEADPYEGMDGPRVTFSEDRVDLGDIRQGDKVTRIFEFRNSGNQPLIIENVLTTCGCTVPEWPKQPIEPGAEGILKVVFDSTGKIGRQNKTITMRSNALGQLHRVRISAMVMPPGK